MDSDCISSFIRGCQSKQTPVTLNYDQYTDPFNGIQMPDPSMNFGSVDTNFAGNPASLASVSANVDFPLDETDFSGPVLGYISQMLMEEDMGDKPSMFHDSLALQATEESLYEVIGKKYSSSSSVQHPLPDYHRVETSEESVAGNISDHSSSGSYAVNGTNSAESQWSNLDFTEYKPSLLQATFPVDFVFQSPSTSAAQLSTNNMSTSGHTSHKYNGFVVNYNTWTGFSDSTLLSKNESLFQFERGVEEASKFLPKDDHLIIDVGSNIISPPFGKTLEALVKPERYEMEHVSAGSRGRKNHEREYEIDLEDRRSRKQPAIYTDESELSELFDKVLLGTGWGKEPPPMCICHENCNHGAKTSVQKKEVPNKSTSDGKSRVRRQGYNNYNEVVDLRALLIQCAQAVSSDDRGTAYNLLRQIRQHSSSTGSGSQRLAHCFANALEARLAGTGSQIYTALSSKRTSAADMIKAYQMYITACPFRKIAVIFANHTILHLSSEAETLHLIDFGIRYGFQWPPFIFRLSKRTGGPPKLRITGIDLPRPGLRPAERVQETGRRLARYCERYNVPFEYNAIAQKWETIRLEDLKIKKDELVVVSCLKRLKNLLDETVVVNSPRDTVLKLIRKANPSMFLQTIVNGCYNAPFFVTRFREALFHYSSMFDMLDTNADSEDPMRLMFEKEFLGQEVTNIIACEGFERTERPETYKQWQVRNMKAGFRPLPLDRYFVSKLRGKLREVFHSDFMLDEDGNWMLQGWKGRIICASSCWSPA
ncbi:scarecrow-like protein 33 [Neltuma alba]|uniref:scarecrow-like protein 33 n=1 Tax=Neltuma alba TaxID=207710 RepID=UPI0010A530D7|nr:scarecrow-like protein 33 [Prosopis alba]